MSYSLRGEIQLFLSGTHHAVQQLLGAHFAVARGRDGVTFRTYAPNAKSVSVVGDFSGWKRDMSPMKKEHDSGVWAAFVPGLKPGALYKYSIEGADGVIRLKSDPFALACESPPADASKVESLGGFKWSDNRWLQKRADENHPHCPVNIYEVHLGSWRRHADGSAMTFAEAAKPLADYVKEMGYTHVEFMPLTEYPDDDSWGYLPTGYFAPTARYGTPRQFMELVNTLHKAGIGVIMDWTPAHFDNASHGLCWYDGGPCFEYADPAKSEHANQNGKVFDFGKPQVWSFLVSSAMFWINTYHLDGLRVVGLSSMLYLDYDRRRWTPNIYGGREDLEAADFLRNLNAAVLSKHPDVLMLAGETGNWPMVTKPPHTTGLGFISKWNTRWRGEMLDYMSLDPLFRAYNHDKLTFSMSYALDENYTLPVSHREVTNGKRSLLEKMTGPDAQKFAAVRAFLGYMMSHPGKKLLFMGCEFGQRGEWEPGGELEWDLLKHDEHKQLKEYVAELNQFYRGHPALWQVEDSWDGFRWIVPDDHYQNIAVFRRIDEHGGEMVIVVNFAPVARAGYRFGVVWAKSYSVAFCSQEARFGGEGYDNPGPIPCEPVPSHGHQHSVTLNIPPMCTLWLTPAKRGRVAGTKGAPPPNPRQRK